MALSLLQVRFISTALHMLLLPMLHCYCPPSSFHPVPPSAIGNAEEGPCSEDQVDCANAGGKGRGLTAGAPFNAGAAVPGTGDLEAAAGR
jgi:hypothetical protein